MTDQVVYKLVFQDEFSKVIKDAIQGSQKLQKEAKKSVDQNIQIAKSLKSAALQGAGFVGSFIAVGKVVDTIASFDEAMAEVKIKTGATEEEFQKLREQALKLGETTKFSATQAADAQVFLAQAGLDTAKIYATLPDILNLAAAGNLDLAQTADIVTNIMSPFAISVDKSQMVVDSLTSVTTNANTNLIEMGEAMKNVAPVAYSLGFSLQETSSMIGVLADAGIKAERSGTAIKIAFNRLVKPTKEVNDGLEILGINANDVSPAIQSPIKVLEKLSEGFEKIKDPTERARAAVLLFGSEAVASGNVLISQTEKIKELTKIQEENIGITKEQAKEMGDNLAGDIKNLKSAIAGLILNVGDEGLNEELRRVTQTATNFIRAIGQPDEIRNMTGAMEGMLDIMDGVVFVLDNSLKGFSDLFSIIGKIGEFGGTKNKYGLAGAIFQATGATITERGGKILEEEVQKNKVDMQKIIEEARAQKAQEKSNGQQLQGNINVNFTNIPKGTQVSSNLNTNTKVGLGTNLGVAGY